MSASIYTGLIALKSTVLLASAAGRDLYAVNLSPVFRQKNMDVFGRVHKPHPDFEIKRKADVTGTPSDEGWILIDKRKQNAART